MKDSDNEGNIVFIEMKEDHGLSLIINFFFLFGGLGNIPLLLDVIICISFTEFFKYLTYFEVIPWRLVGGKVFLVLQKNIF